MKKSAKKAAKKAAKKNPVGRPPRQDKDNSKVPGAEKWTNPGETRKTYILKKEHIKRIEQIALEDGKSQKDVLSEAMEVYFIQRTNRKQGRPAQD